MKGKRIRTLKELAKAAQERKSLVGWKTSMTVDPKPAAFVLNMIASVVLNRIERGLYIYHPERKKKAPAVRNPEGIDFKKYPIPEGYTVASERDCTGYSAPGCWMIHSGGEWHLLREEIRLRTEWTYLRPIRRGEKVVSA